MRIIIRCDKCFLFFKEIHWLHLESMKSSCWQWSWDSMKLIWFYKCRLFRRLMVAHFTGLFGTQIGGRIGQWLNRSSLLRWYCWKDENISSWSKYANHPFSKSTYLIKYSHNFHVNSSQYVPARLAIGLSSALTKCSVSNFVRLPPLLPSSLISKWNSLSSDPGYGPEGGDSSESS